MMRPQGFTLSLTIRYCLMKITQNEEIKKIVFLQTTEAKMRSH